MIKDKKIRDRFCVLELDDSKEIEDLIIKSENSLKSFENSLINAQNFRKQLDISKDFKQIEELDKKINNLSVAKTYISKKIQQLKEEKNE
jgi:hypothetical protein